MRIVVALLWLADRILALAPAPGRPGPSSAGRRWHDSACGDLPMPMAYERYPVYTSEVSPYYLDALLTYEDRDGHLPTPRRKPIGAGTGDPAQNLSGARVVSRPTSTLSMQVARLLDPHSRTLHGKLRQLWRTAQVGVAPVQGRNPQPVPEPRAFRRPDCRVWRTASWAYLGKSPSQLTHAEAALLGRCCPRRRLRCARTVIRSAPKRPCELHQLLRRLAEFQVWPQSAVDEALDCCPCCSPHVWSQAWRLCWHAA